MAGLSEIDTTFDMRTDSAGKDPDSNSATLRRYHRLLWSKPLPDGTPFDLDARLRHSSEKGDFWLSSDAITHTYSGWSRPARLVTVLGGMSADEMTAFYGLGCTVGAYTLFPYPVRIDGKWRRSINQARGMRHQVRDRFDLTLECIRRHYNGGEPSPLADVLADYADFFRLFDSFRGYVQHFLLDDLVEPDYRSVKFLKAFDDFGGDALPVRDVAEYREYMKRSMDFVRARNARIARYVDATAGTEVD